LRFCLQFLLNSYTTVLGIYGLTVFRLVQGRGEMVFLLAVTEVLFNHSAMNISTDSFFYTGYRGNGGSLQLPQYSYITVLWIYGIRVELLVEGRG